MTQISEEQLQAWFEQFRHRFFGGRLSKWRIAIGSGQDPDIVDESGYSDAKSKTLYIAERALYSGKEAKTTLLHEMCHAAVGRWHGKRFQAETARLKKEGAPIVEPELKNLIRLSSELISSSIDDGLMEGLSLEQAQTQVARVYLGGTRERLLKRYPKASQGTLRAQ